MLKVNIGGAKGFGKFSKEIQDQWKVLDRDKRIDFSYDLNSGRKFPLKDKEVDYYYASMVLEHVKPGVLPFVIKEMYRTLKQNGKIRIVVPDIIIGIHAYLNKDKWLYSASAPSPDADYPPTLLGNLMSWFYSEGKHGYGHKLAFDWETLVYYIGQAGFKSIERLAYNKCSDAFKGKDFLRYKNYGIYLEAMKI